jgi:AbrB family looped-hinge helix DNA binding protein
MNARRGTIVSGGRLIVPAEFRRLMGLSDGDTVVMEIEGDELHVRPLRAALRRVQERLKPYAIEGKSISDELIADRRAAADRE